MFKNYYLYVFLLILFIIIVSFYNEYSSEHNNYSIQEKFTPLSKKKNKASKK